MPNFKELKLTEEELFDLCELSSTDKSKIDTCIENKQKNLMKNINICIAGLGNVGSSVVHLIEKILHFSIKI